MHSEKFEQLKTDYQDNFCTLDQLQSYVKLGVITQAEFSEITA